jgi:hypothetical protein
VESILFRRPDLTVVGTANDGRMVSFVPGAQFKVQFIEQILRTLTVASDQRHTNAFGCRIWSSEAS